MSAYSASAPVTASTTAASAKNAVPKCPTMNCQRVDRRKRLEDFRMRGDAADTAGTDRCEPDDHHRPEQPTDGGRAVALHREQRNDDHRGERHDPPMPAPARRP